MPLKNYNIFLDSTITSDLIEDPLLSVSMKLSKTGVLSVKGQFIEDTRSYSNTKMALTRTGNFHSRFFIITESTPSAPDYSSCEMTFIPSASLTEGGGTTFDCYTNNVDVTSLPQAGTGIGLWGVGDSVYGLLYSETFNNVVTQNPLTETITSDHLNSWVHNDNPYGIIGGESFNTMVSENPLTSSIFGSMGGTDVWCIGNGL